VPNKKNKITPYELWTKKKPNLNYLRVWGCKVAVSFPDPKMKTLGERGIECIFIGYAEHSKAFSFYVIEPNDSVAINFIIESRDSIFDEKANNDEMDSIMGNNTWVLTCLLLGCKPLGCKWIFKRKLKVDGTVENFKARLVILGFKQESGIDYFDTYALVARITTIRLLIVMASIHSLIIRQIDVNTAFLNGAILGFILLGNENKVCKLIKSLYGLKQAPNKFDASGKGVIICLYVDDMLIFGTDQVQVDMTKEFLSSRFSMKDMGETDVILGIRIKHKSNVSTPMDTCEKLMPNGGLAVSQLEYSRVIDSLMYTMTYTILDIAFVVGKLSSNTKYNSSTSGWVFLLCGGAISWAFKKQTCITGFTMEYEFVAMVAAGNEAEWLKNLLFEIPLWVKPIAPIFIRCDNATTLATAYS
nr:zinc finger, CCHC-type [Tanacetum cinerariifolium]